MSYSFQLMCSYNTDVYLELVLSLFLCRRRSETSFHIFIAMASRRLQADRFFTSDFTPEVFFLLFHAFFFGLVYLGFSLLCETAVVVTNDDDDG